MISGDRVPAGPLDNRLAIATFPVAQGAPTARGHASAVPVQVAQGAVPLAAPNVTAQLSVLLEIFTSNWTPVLEPSQATCNTGQSSPR